MGDFWPGNIVLNLAEQSIYVVDWELAKTGLEGLDLGQFCAEIHTLRRFHSNRSNSAKALISTFLQAHRQAQGHSARSSLALACNVLAHTGAYLVALTPRFEWGGREDTRAVVTEGLRILIMQGSRVSHDRLKASLAAPLID